MPNARGPQVSARESVLLVESLQTAGWPLSWIEREGGLAQNSLSLTLRSERISVARRDLVRVVFQRLRELAPPEDTHERKRAVSVARKQGQRYHGVLPSALPAVPWAVEVLAS